MPNTKNASLDDARVAVVQDEPRYSSDAPYHPSEQFPEWPNSSTSETPNPGFRAVRRLFATLGLDQDRFGSAAWNPLSELIQPGDRVVLKPNLVAHKNLGERRYGLTDTDSLITHGSVIRAALDYAAKALRGTGRIVIADCPLQGTDWAAVVRLAGLDSIQTYFRARYPKIGLQVRDFRLGRAIMRDGNVLARVIDETNLQDYAEVDLGTASYLEPISKRGCEFGVAQYGRKRLLAAHEPGKHKYLIPLPVLDADVFINLPKMKTHMKAGLTLSLKNLVGINGHKDYLPHFRFLSPKDGGDEYPDGGLLWDLMWRLTHADWDRESGNAKRLFGTTAKVLTRAMQAVGYHSACSELGAGSWHGNDTVWRTVLDINAALFYWDKQQRRVGTSPRTDQRYLTVVDGLVGGHKEGPLAPEPIASGVVFGGFNPLAVDATGAALMGFDLEKTTQTRRAFGAWPLPLSSFGQNDITITGVSGTSSLDELGDSTARTGFTPARGFAGHIERADNSRVEPKRNPVNKDVWQRLSEQNVLPCAPEVAA